MQIALLGFGDVIRHGRILDFSFLFHYNFSLFKIIGVIEPDRKNENNTKGLLYFTSKIKTV